MYISNLLTFDATGEAYAVCDLVEMPLSINPNKNTARVISLIVSASFLGDGYLTSPSARKFLRGTILDKNDGSGSFGFNPYFTSEEATFQNDKYVSFKNTAYKFWKKILYVLPAGTHPRDLLCYMMAPNCMTR